MLDRLPATEPRLESVLISAAEIEARVNELAARITQDFPDQKVLHLVAVLKGAWVFLADLARAIRRAGGPPVHYHFLRASTYGQDLKVAGEQHREVRIEGIPESIRGGDVILVEDILDQGFTLAGVRRLLLEQHGVRSLRLCVFLNKRLATPTAEVERLRRELIPDYVGFDVPDRWVAGYGLDVGEDFRDLPYVAVVDEARCRG
jgi:hypoxanthine phosphoribosyltransferase